MATGLAIMLIHSGCISVAPVSPLVPLDPSIVPPALTARPIVRRRGMMGPGDLHIGSVVLSEIRQSWPDKTRTENLVAKIMGEEWWTIAQQIEFSYISNLGLRADCETRIQHGPYKTKSPGIRREVDATYKLVYLDVTLRAGGRNIWEMQVGGSDPAEVHGTLEKPGTTYTIKPIVLAEAPWAPSGYHFLKDELTVAVVQCAEPGTFWFAEDGPDEAVISAAAAALYLNPYTHLTRGRSRTVYGVRGGQPAASAPIAAE